MAVFDCFCAESNHKREGGQKTQNLDYVIHGWAPTYVSVFT